MFIPEGATSAKFTLQTLDDNLKEGEEYFSYTLINPVGVSLVPGMDRVQGKGAVYLWDDETVPVEVGYSLLNQSPIVEGDTIGFRITLSRPASSQVETGIVFVPGGTADAQDGIVSPDPVVFAPGETTKDVFINTVDNGYDEADATAYFKLAPIVSTSDPPVIGDTNSVSWLTIADNDAAPYPYTYLKDGKLSNHSNLWWFSPGKEKVSTLAGSDVIQYSEGDGKDEIADFQRGFDRVQLDNVSVGSEHINSFAELQSLATVTSDRRSITVNFGGGDSLTITGVTDLNAADWMFA